MAAIQPAQETWVVRIKHKDAHEWLDRVPEAVILVDPRLVGAAGDVTPPWLVTTARPASLRSRNRRCSGCRVHSQAWSGAKTLLQPGAFILGRHARQHVCRCTILPAQ